MKPSAPARIRPSSLLLLILAAALILIGIQAKPASAQSGPLTPVRLSPGEARAIYLVNHYRANHGLGPVEYAPSLSSEAGRFSREGLLPLSWSGSEQRISWMMNGCLGEGAAAFAYKQPASKSFPLLPALPDVRQDSRAELLNPQANRIGISIADSSRSVILLAHSELPAPTHFRGQAYPLRLTSCDAAKLENRSWFEPARLQHPPPKLQIVKLIQVGKRLRLHFRSDTSLAGSRVWISRNSSGQRWPPVQVRIGAKWAVASWRQPPAGRAFELVVRRADQLLSEPFRLR